jgi:phage terminase small subunit
MNRELTSRQAAFVAAYVANGGIGAEAARKAGFSFKGAASAASNLLDKPAVVDAIAALRRGRAQ